jgi:hypothetical protein
MARTAAELGAVVAARDGGGGGGVEGGCVRVVRFGVWTTHFRGLNGRDEQFYFRERKIIMTPGLHVKAHGGKALDEFHSAIAQTPWIEVDLRFKHWRRQGGERHEAIKLRTIW